MNKLKREFLTTYMDINHNGEIIFRSVININIIRNAISKRSALVIIYEALNQIDAMGITDIFDVDRTIIPKLIEDFKKHPNNGNFANGKRYRDEIYTVMSFLNEISEKKNIDFDVVKLNYSYLILSDNTSSRDIEDNKTEMITTNDNAGIENKKFINSNSNDFIEEEKDFSDENSTDNYWLSHKFNAKKIKKSLNQFNKEELCYILDIDSKCCLEKEKSLKNDIVQSMRNRTFKMEDIDYLSHNELKEFYRHFIGKVAIEKAKLNEYLEEIKSFNRLYFNEMYDLKEDYIQLKRIVDGFQEKNKDIETFKKYFNAIMNESFIRTYSFLKDTYHKIEEFNKEFSNFSFYNYETRNHFSNKLKYFNQSYFEVLKFEKSIQEKIYQELPDLKKFFKIKESLLEYENLSKAPEDNLIKISNEKYVEEQFGEFDKTDNIEDDSDEKIIDESKNLLFDDFTKLLEFNIEDNEIFNITFNLDSELINKLVDTIDLKQSDFISNNVTTDKISDLIADLKDYASSITFIFSTKSFSDEEKNSITDRIRFDIEKGIVDGNMQSIVSFYLNQYKDLKEKIMSLAYLNEYVKSKFFSDFLNVYPYDESSVEYIINKTKSDIIYNDLSYDDIQTKIKIYFEQNEVKKEQYNELNNCKKDFHNYLKEYNLTYDELNEIFDEIQNFIDENYGSMKPIEDYLISKIKYQVSLNQSRSRKKLSLFSINKLINVFNISEELSENIIDQVEESIYNNDLRSEELNGFYLFDIVDENLKLSDEYGI